MTETIHVPDIPGPRTTLCWKQCNPADPPFTHAMERCDRRLGHKGPHVWEFARTIDRLTAELETSRG